VLAFGDANATWAPDALRQLVRNFADPDVAYVCGQVRFQREDGTNREGVYWRYELWLRESESALGSITGGNGAIYAVRRSDYVEWPFGHDPGFPTLMAQQAPRAVSEGEAGPSAGRRRRPARTRAATTRTSSGARCGCCRGRGATCSRRSRCAACRRCTCSSWSRTACSATRAASCT